MQNGHLTYMYPHPDPQELHQQRKLQVACKNGYCLLISKPHLETLKFA